MREESTDSREREGMKAAKTRGVRVGPKMKLTPERIAHAKALIQEGESRLDIANLFGVSRSTLYRTLLAQEASR
jgi:DNA invertase Pin-like site-specific DNA recombinase